jgi:inner membrane protein
MPSPVGHVLGGLIVGQVLAPSALVICAVAAVGPDLDFAWGRHSMETHSVGAALLAGAVAFAWKRDARFAAAVALAWASHIVFDWLGSDETAPIGVMALWPFNSNFYFADAYIFEAITRRYWLDNFITHNVWAVIKETLILGPLAFMAFRWRARRRSRRPGTA